MLITERQISYIKNTKTHPQRTTLANALEAISYPPNSIDTIKKIREVEKRIQALRFDGKISEADALKDAEKKPLKIDLPAFIFSAICEGGHANEHVIQRTGIVCLDFDSDSPTTTEQWQEFRDNLINVKQVFYTALSVSGCGVMALLEIADPERQEQHFEQMKADFTALLKRFDVQGAKLDPSKGGNPAQLRFITYDPQARFKPDYQVYDRLPPPKAKPKPRPHTPVYPVHSTADNAFQICMQQITQGRVSIADEYRTWFAIGVSFANTFGESGRNDFHRVSEQSTKYNPRECDKLYSDIIRGVIRGSYNKQQDLSYFFGVCKGFGITYKDKLTRPQTIPKPKTKPIPANVDPETGEIFEDDTAPDYPADWDDVQVPQPGTDEHREMLKAELDAGAISEAEYLQQTDPKAARIIQLFDAVPEQSKSRAYMI